MADLGSHRCHNCNMVFRSYSLLEKHKEKFCIGSHGGDPTNLLLSGRGVPGMTETPDFRTRGSVAHLRVKESLLTEREKHLLDGYGRPDAVSDSRALKHLTDEFHKLRKSLEVTVPSLRSTQFQDEASPWDREYRERMQEMAEAHERHLADIQARNQALELQREDIRQRLSEVAGAGSSTGHIEQMLLELKAQEEKNQLALDDLRNQVGLIQSESRTRPEKSNQERAASAPAKKEKPPLHFITFPSHGSSLSSEISALQLAYVQSGGSEAAVLAQMRDLQAEAMAFEEMSHKQERKEKKKRRHEGSSRVLDVELMAVQLENQRLEEEIFSLKLQRNKKKAEKGEAEMFEMQREHVQQMAQLQADMEMLRRDMSRMPPRVSHGPPPFLPPPGVPPLPPPMHATRQLPGKPEPVAAMGVLDSMRPPSPSANRHILEPLDALGPAPYDPVAGFVIFYEFLLGLEPTYQKVRLLTGLYSNGHRMGQTTSLPDALCEMWQPSHHLSNAPRGNIALLSAKQPIPRVRPGSSIALVVELQASGGFNPYGQEVPHMASRGWAKLDLFDQHNQVLSGRWKLPVRALPLRPGLSTGQLNTVPQVGKAELFLRVMNARDAEIQSLAEIDPRNASLYQYPPLMIGPNATITENPTQQPVFHHPPHAFNVSFPPYTDYVDPPPVQELPNQQRTSQRPLKSKVEGAVAAVNAQDGEDTVGFIIDRVKNAPLGDGTLRLTGYHLETGQVINTRGTGMTGVLSAVSSSVKHGYFMFGEQELIFRDVTAKEDMILVLRFYHWPGGSTAGSPWHNRRTLEPLLASEEWAAAWTVLKLTKLASSGARKGLSDTVGSALEWNTGTHELALYHCPAPPVQSLTAILPEHYEKVFEQYGSARVRLCVFGGSRPEFPFPPESPTIKRHVQEVPEAAYIPLYRTQPVSEPYSSTDAIDLFIDGARFLPDAVTVTQVTGRIFDKNFEQFGPDISCDADLNSDIFHPFYNYSLQIRSLTLPPTATLLLKVYTIDRFTKGLSLIGWAALSLFVESGSQKAPTSNSEEVKISLNNGAHQIRVYHKPPPTDRPFSVASLASSGRIVPCATLLVRVMKASNRNKQEPGQNGENIPQTLPRPEYSHRVYFSDSAQPTEGEIELYRSMINRSVVRVKDVIPLLAGSSHSGLWTNRELSQWAQKIFTQKKDQIPPPFMICCVSPYNLMSGVKVSADRAQNLPWSGFTLGHVCLNPPGAFYFGHPWAKYDHPVLVEDIDLNSNQNCPAWNDGFKTFTWRMFNEHLTSIFQLHEILLQKEKESISSDSQPTKQEHRQAERASPVLEHGTQAWTALQVFYKHYCHMGVYQLPLYHGAPTPDVLQALSTEDCHIALKEMEKKQAIKRIPGASLTVRIADGRRHMELSTYDQQQDIDRSYLPGDVGSYTTTIDGEEISSMIPEGQDNFKNTLAHWLRKYLTQPSPTDTHQESNLNQPQTEDTSAILTSKKKSAAVPGTLLLQASGRL